MSKLNQEKLLEWLDNFKYGWSYYPKASLYKKGLVEQAYQQIKEMIQKPNKKRGLTGMAGEIFNEAHKNQPEVTEEWIEEKARRLHEMSWCGYTREEIWTIEMKEAKDFISSLFEEIRGK